MSKGNGRRNNNGKGNGMDKFNGTCNGVSSSTHFQDLSDYSVKKNNPNSNDSKTENDNNSSQLTSTKKEFKSKLK